MELASVVAISYFKDLASYLSLNKIESETVVSNFYLKLAILLIHSIMLTYSYIYYQILEA